MLTYLPTSPLQKFAWKKHKATRNVPFNVQCLLHHESLFNIPITKHCHRGLPQLLIRPLPVLQVQEAGQTEGPFDVCGSHRKPQVGSNSLGKRPLSEDGGKCVKKKMHKQSPVLPKSGNISQRVHVWCGDCTVARPFVLQVIRPLHLLFPWGLILTIQDFPIWIEQVLCAEGGEGFRLLKYEKIPCINPNSWPYPWHFVGQGFSIVPKERSMNCAPWQNPSTSDAWLEKKQDVMPSQRAKANLSSPPKTSFARQSSPQPWLWLVLQPHGGAESCSWYGSLGLQPMHGDGQPKPPPQEQRLSVSNWPVCKCPLCGPLQTSESEAFGRGQPGSQLCHTMVAFAEAMSSGIIFKIAATFEGTFPSGWRASSCLMKWKKRSMLSNHQRGWVLFFVFLRGYRRAHRKQENDPKTKMLDVKHNGLGTLARQKKHCFCQKKKHRKCFFQKKWKKVICFSQKKMFSFFRAFFASHVFFFVYFPKKDKHFLFKKFWCGIFFKKKPCFPQKSKKKWFYLKKNKKVFGVLF